jgi:ATP/maltotriose-dependent transcriptional regulator MalT
LADTAAPHLAAADQGAWLDRLDAELDNLRAAIAFSLTQADPEPGLRPAASLNAYRRARGHAAEGAAALQALLNAPGAQEPTLPRARAMVVVANLFQQIGSYPIAGDYCQEALGIARAAGDDGLVGELLQVQAWVLLRQGQRAEALPLIEQGLDLARRLGSPHLTAFLLASRAHAKYAAGNTGGAAADAAESLRLFRQAGDRQHVATLLGNLGNYELSTGDLDAARAHLSESLNICRTLNHRDGIAYQTLDLGLAEYLGGSTATAGDLFAESLDLTRRMGMKALAAYALLGGALVRPAARRRRPGPNILRKFGLSSRAAAAAWGIRTGLV